MTNLPPIEIDPETFLYKNCELPALPEVLTKVQGLVSSGDFTAIKVSEIISTDPSMVAEILKIANSAYYSFPKEIKDVKFAIAYMGIVEIQRIILTVSVVNTLSTKDKVLFNKIWFHSMYTALCAQYLVKKYEPLVSPGEIWAAAILHDVGKLVYLKFFPEHLKSLIQYAEENNCYFHEAEQIYKFPASSYLGKLICDRWRLPSTVKYACSYHGLNDLLRSTEASIESTFTRIISASNLLTSMMVEKLSKEKAERISNTIKQIFNLSDPDFMLIAADISELKLSAEKLVS